MKRRLFKTKAALITRFKNELTPTAVICLWFFFFLFHFPPFSSLSLEQTRVLVIALGRNSPNKYYAGYRQLEAGAKPRGKYQLPSWEG
jgi:hypothetical protein